MTEQNREFEIFAELTDPSAHRTLDDAIHESDHKETGLATKMKLVQAHYINCTDGIDSCNICEMVHKLMEDYTSAELMEGIELD